MSIDQFPGAQLGQEPVMLQKIRSGDIDFVITSTANASTVAPQAGVLSLHFIFRDQKHLASTIADPNVSKAFREMVKDSVQGAQVLALMTMGMRNMYSKKEIKSVDDVKGQKVRVQATKTEDTHFPAYGPRPCTCRSARSTPRCRPASSTSPRTASTFTWPTNTTKWRRSCR